MKGPGPRPEILTRRKRPNPKSGIFTACLLAAGFCLLAGCGRITQPGLPDRQAGARKNPQPSGSAVASAVLAAVDTDFEAKVLKADLPVLVDFWAPWCGPCRSQSPIIEKVAASYAGKLRTVRVNVDEAQQTAKQYQIAAIPTLIVFRAGKIVLNRTGLIDEATLSAELQKLF